MHDIVELSKTKRKQQVENLQKLGMQLVELSLEKLHKIELPSRLLDAIILARKLTANGAIRRQNQYIGRLMRDIDDNYIRDKLIELDGDSAANTRILHACEKWREKLVAEDKELNTFINEYQVIEINELRNLIRSTRREQAQGQIKSYRKLFKFIRDVLVLNNKRDIIENGE
ncbi:MAG: DUF615 domain-containing protein [Burkholderiales bacterium]|nr:DUF615 domain-containing protein [Burkholderiales bacterium]